MLQGGFLAGDNKIDTVQIWNARPDLSCLAGRATDRDVAVTRTAQGIFKLILWAAGWRVVVKGVYPRHFSSGFTTAAWLWAKRFQFA